MVSRSQKPDSGEGKDDEGQQAQIIAKGWQEAQFTKRQPHQSHHGSILNARKLYNRKDK